MATRKQSRGTCAYCGKEMGKGGISKHLQTCPGRQAAIAKAEQGKGTPELLYHLRIQDSYNPGFWLDLEMRGSKSLKDLDFYLRGIWLECCGHLSEFSAGGFMHTVGKTRKIKEVFPDGEGQLLHVYDFGTSSETIVKCVGVRQGKPTTSKAIALMARNTMPLQGCIECGQPATHLCLECVYEADAEGTLCDAHTEKHPHHNYGDPLPLMNSPRTGMCGYTGPADPPY
ncbi:MAG: hypothetical protein NW220_20090 [Leptolyngbyaceae cyanobacterium bins.349]|nr:hypothetical protein [Leptolyngbyaceae cyanobacterium bins.349]